MLVYQSRCLEDATGASDRGRTERLRQARRAPTIYGSNVHRRLRGRWFSLVPVRRRAMAGVTGAVGALVAVLCLAHGLALFWQPLAELPQIARPLRLDRPDSFGTWARAAMLALAAGASLLIYQLRRHRNDDFRGSYRIWPPLIVLMAVASFDAVVNLVPWLGAIIEWCVGRRVALSGADWIRIALTVGGAALSLRMIAEVRSSRLAALLMTATVAVFAAPLAAHWGVLSDQSPIRWLLVTSAPLVAAALLMLACVAYLRKLFREVRKLDEDDPVSLRWRQWMANLGGLRKRSTTEKPAEVAAPATRKAKPRAKPAAKSSEVASPESQPDSKPSRTGFRWWPRWRRNGTAASDAAQDGKATSDAKSSEPVTKPVVSNAPPAKPAPVVAKGASSAGPQNQNPAEGTEAAKKASKGGGWLSGWFRRSQGAESLGDETAGGTADRSGSPPNNGKNPTPAPQNTRQPDNDTFADDDDDDDSGHDPSADLSKLSKAERRRLRRENKRGGHAA
ncbi:MAG: hypothetical protein EA381_01510 [Planctomycetaceae bacterium]|nr:MAG: hypothetical protein EA381_01510 [Planctomycetaceae bacterium]